MDIEPIKSHIVAGIVIKQDGKYLLVQENHPNPKVYGTWNFPAGWVDAGETIEQAAIREAKEEVGLEVELVRKIGVHKDTPESAERHAYEAKIVGGEIKFPEDEILDVQWFTFDEIQAMQDKLRSNWILAAISIMENKI